jgi:hypothetical protein
MRKDDLLPKQMRLMTDDGLRFVASYRGMINFANKIRSQGGPHADRWGTAARKVSAAIESGDEIGIKAAVDSFSQAARYEGWVS